MRERRVTPITWRLLIRLACRGPARPWVLGALLYGLATWTPVLGAGDAIPTYKERFTAKGGGLFGYDIHAWLYPPSAAKRFQMPREWASRELEGALALAYRVEWHTGMKCGFEDEPRCRRRVRCVLDAYWDQGSGLPFRNDLGVNQDSFSGDSSMHWLSPQSRADFEQIRQIQRSNTLAGPVLLAYTDPEGQRRFQEINTFQYERRMYKLDSVSFQLDCGLPPQLGESADPVTIYIGKADVSAAALERRVTHGEPKGSINRVISIPASFHRRWRRHHGEYMDWEPAYYDMYAEALWRADKAFSRKTYQQRFTSESSTPYDRDVHIWTYTDEFAERFGMPAQWIAKEDLGDAVALAFRVQRDVAGTCGAGYDLDNCQRFEKCMWDVYFPDEAPLPWYVDWPVANVGGGEEASLRFLQPNDRELSDEVDRVSNLSKFIYGADGEPYDKIVAPIGNQIERRVKYSFLGIPYWSDWEWKGGTSPSVWSFERRLPGLEMLSIYGMCSTRSGWERVKAGEKRQVRNSRIVFSRRPMSTYEFWNDGLHAEDGAGELAAVVAKLPERFYWRWKEHETSVNRSVRRIERTIKDLNDAGDENW